MSEPHKVYLAIPGKQICWGTVTGVAAATRKNIALPYNGGLGFSGVIDFNILWTDAHNLYEEGKITHFAMLHGDIAPNIEEPWIDILLEEMDARDAEMVSAHSPIKDMRGVTSCGIGDPKMPWGAFRRFTQREILEDLPETFNNVLAGYRDQPLLHNTACWVCDLRKPVFQKTNDDGTLKLFFKFPERIARGKDGKWEHQQESEDWYFSRKLWEAGVTNTWITRRVKFVHHGAADWPNDIPFGQFKDGDENTAENWRDARDAKPLALVQLLQFELSDKCNLSQEHLACPNAARHYGPWGRPLDDDTIVRLAVEAYRDLGFSGLVGWAYYNEPLLERERMFHLMDRIRREWPAARFILWTNGTLIPEECERFAQFEQIVVSGYNDLSRRGRDRLIAKGVSADRLKYMDNPGLDDRMVASEPSCPSAPCLRPFVEFVIDFAGAVHLCCYDWKGESFTLNVHDVSLAEAARQWRKHLANVAGSTMTADAPEFCRHCNHRWAKYQQHDEAIVARARRWRAKWTGGAP